MRSELDIPQSHGGIHGELNRFHLKWNQAYPFLKIGPPLVVLSDDYFYSPLPVLAFCCNSLGNKRGENTNPLLSQSDASWRVLPPPTDRGPPGSQHHQLQMRLQRSAVMIY